MQVNEATGEVTVELGGKTFVLHAKMPRVAAFQAAIGVKDFSFYERLKDGDCAALYQALRCLCVSGNEAELDELLLSDYVSAAFAIVRALTFGNPPEEVGHERGNGAATKAEPAIRPGRDTERSLTAS